MPPDSRPQHASSAPDPRALLRPTRASRDSIPPRTRPRPGGRISRLARASDNSGRCETSRVSANASAQGRSRAGAPISWADGREGRSVAARGRFGVATDKPRPRLPLRREMHHRRALLRRFMPVRVASASLGLHRCPLAWRSFRRSPCSLVWLEAGRQHSQIGGWLPLICDHTLALPMRGNALQFCECSLTRVNQPRSEVAVDHASGLRRRLDGSTRRPNGGFGTSSTWPPRSSTTCVVSPRWPTICSARSSSSRRRSRRFGVANESSSNGSRGPRGLPDPPHRRPVRGHRRHLCRG